MNNQPVPQSQASEICLVGCLILDTKQEIMADVFQEVTEADFNFPDTKVIFRAIRQLYNTTTIIDIISVKTTIETNGDLVTVGGAEGLVKIIDSVPSMAGWKYYLEQVKETSHRRQLIQALERSLGDAYDQQTALSDVMDSVEARVFAVTEQAQQSRSETVSMAQIIPQTIEAINERAKGERPAGIETGFVELDQLTGGLRGGELIVPAGRPSMGKTAFVLSLLSSLTIHKKVPVVFFSLEMSKEEIAERLLSINTRVPHSHLRNGWMHEEDYQQIDAVKDMIINAPLNIVDCAKLSPMELRSRVRTLIRLHDIQVVVVDYLQLMTIPGFRDGRFQEVGSIVRSLKSLAREVQKPVIAIAQIRRSGVGKADKRPVMDELKDSGEIEQAADVIMLIHREHYYKKGKTGYIDGKPCKCKDGSLYSVLYENCCKDKAELIIEKQRSGPTGVIIMKWNGPIMRFEPWKEVTNE